MSYLKQLIEQIYNPAIGEQWGSVPTRRGVSPLSRADLKRQKYYDDYLESKNRVPTPPTRTNPRGGTQTGTNQASVAKVNVAPSPQVSTQAPQQTNQSAEIQRLLDLIYPPAGAQQNTMPFAGGKAAGR